MEYKFIKLKKVLYTTAFLSACINTYSQVRISNSINNTAAANSSAFIDASSNTAYNQSANVGKGLLYPRTDLTSFTAFSGVPTGVPTSYPTLYDGLIVYNTANSGVAGVGSTDGTLCRGFWYYENPTSSLNGGVWKRVGPCSTTGNIVSLDCAGVINTGTLIDGIPASGVSSEIGYTGGNQGTYNGQAIPSTGVAGLTAAIPPGSFVNGSGTLTYTITGTPSGPGTASFAINIGGQSCVLTFPVGGGGPSQFTITSCGTPVGYLAKGLPANSADIAAKQQIQVNVTTPGTYSFTTPTLNGVTFSASGSFSSAGAQTVELVASGTPTDYTVDNNAITYLVTGTSGGATATCSFARNIYMPDQNYTGAVRNDGKHRFLYKVITGPGGKEWLQTNLGAHYNQVGHPNFNPEMAATNVDDFLAFGSLFQLGRNSDGHELVAWSSATSGTSSGSIVSYANYPHQVDFNTLQSTGSFVTLSSPSLTGSTDDIPARIIMDNLFKMGPGTPCPSSFGIAIDEYSVAGGQGPAYWLSNSLKLVAPKMYKNAVDGSLTTMSSRLLRTNKPAIFPYAAALSPQYTIEGILPAGRDRRHSESSDTDGRGIMDGYPVRCVKMPTAVSNISLNCNSISKTGVLTAGVQASGVSFMIYYQGNTIESHNGQTMTSTGVTGLTATLAPGSFINGGGFLTYTITGTPSGAGTAFFNINVNGHQCSAFEFPVNSPGGGAAQFTIASCGTSVGYLAKGLPANTIDIVSKQQVQVNVTTPGTYNLSTPTVNGVSFSASGTFATTGAQTVELTASGVPTNYTVDNNTIAYTVSGTSGSTTVSCNFTRKVYMPDQNYTGTIRNDGKHRFLYKVITGPKGKQWLQTNLGAHYNQVGHPGFNPEMAATNVNDFLAFGSLFQGGRNSDGHELINWSSATSGTSLAPVASFANFPLLTNFNNLQSTGSFVVITTSTTSTGQIFPYRGALINGRHAAGPGAPCPDGFSVAIHTFGGYNYDYPETSYNAGSAYWLNDPLKLVAPQVYHDGVTGNMTAMPRRLMRMNQLAIFRDFAGLSPEFVIEGGEMHYSNSADTPSVVRDRRGFETYNPSITGIPSDQRGVMDGYPVRCVKP
jgi:nitrogen fixation protein FixH